MLYLLLCVVFSDMSKKWWPFLLIGYCKCTRMVYCWSLHVALFCIVTPLSIVTISVGIRHEYYGVRDSCGDLL